MTIRPGDDWGRPVPTPPRLVVADGDPAVVRLLAAPGPDEAIAIAVRRGDLARTVGSPVLDGRATLNELPIDLVEVRLGDAGPLRRACAHVTAHSPWRRGGWLRGRAVVIMNAEFLHGRDVAPRGHPNDGRVECFEVAAGMSVRDRLRAFRRARNATHVPHPDITQRSLRAGSWSFPHPVVVRIDGRRAATVRSFEMTVIADAAVIHA